MITRTRLVTPPATSSDITHLICLHDARSCTSICRQQSTSEPGCDTCEACYHAADESGHRCALCWCVVRYGSDLAIGQTPWAMYCGGGSSRSWFQLQVGDSGSTSALGSIGDTGCFSFHGTKNVTSWGQGGALVINNHSNLKATQCTYCNGTNRVNFMAWNASEHTWITSGLDC